MENKFDKILEKILEEKDIEDVNEVKVDLKRVMNMVSINSINCGYVEYLYNYYSYEIEYINSMQMINNNYGIVNNVITNRIIEMQKYLIKIAIMRICRKKGREILFERINNNDFEYCLELLK